MPVAAPLNSGAGRGATTRSFVQYLIFRSVNDAPPTQRKAIRAPRLTTTYRYATTTTASEPVEMTAVELEIARLTNELRTNPSGPQARTRPQPSCVSTGGAGQPLALPALAVNEAVSIEMARDWSIAMNQAGAMSHRPSSEQLAIYNRLGVNVWAWGENVAWFSGFSDAQSARVLFEGWRESDGHYCNMMSSSYTHIGVGVQKGATRTWATQNFYGTP